MYKTILIASDGSEFAAKGLEHGLALAAPLGAKVTVLTVTLPLDSRALEAAVAAGVPDPLGRYDQSVDDEMKSHFAAITQRAQDAGVTVGFAHEIDEVPAEAIVRHAEVNGADLIIMTSHGRRGFRRMLLGSQTAEVLAHTRIPVLVVR